MNYEPSVWQEEAVEEYYQNEISLADTGTTYFTGIMQCFCNNLKEHGRDVNQIFKYTPKSGKIYAKPVCKIYYNDLLVSFVFG